VIAAHPQASRVGVTRATLGGKLGRHLTPAVLAVLAIAMGVALAFAVHLINQAAIAEFSAGLASLAGETDLEVRGPRAGFDETLYPTLALDEDVATASPVLEIEAKIHGRSEALPLLGVDAFRAGIVTPALLGTSEDSLDALRPDAVFVSAAAAAWLGVDIGDAIGIQAGLAEIRLRVAGFVRGETAQRYAVMDIAAAQDGFARLGRLSRIDLRLRPGADVAGVRTRLQQLLPVGVVVERPEAAATATTRMSRAYRVNLNVLALVALFTGGLLVFSTQALSVLRRRAQFALLRTLGLSRGRLLALLLGEGAVLGMLGAALGLFSGYLLAVGALHWFGGDLGAGFFRGLEPTVRIEPLATIVLGALGVVAAVLGTLAPALEAARAAPAAALKAGDDQQVFTQMRAAGPGLACLGAGAFVVWLPPVAALPLFGYLAIALLLTGTLLLMPRLASLLLSAVPAPSAPSVALAVQQLRNAPGQAGVSLATLVASVSLMVSMAIMVASFRQSLEDWLERVLPADVYLRAALAGDSAFLGQDDQHAIATLPGVRRVDFLRVQSLLLEAGRPRVAMLARDLDRADPARHLPLVDEKVLEKPPNEPLVWVSEAMVDLYGYAVGQEIALPLAGQRYFFTVAGVWRDYARQQGAVVIDRAVYTRLTGDTTANDAAVWLAAGADVTTLRRELAARVTGGDKITVTPPGEIRELSLKVFDRTFAVTYALEAAAVIIGLTGLSSSFGALVLARRREFGVLRHLGMTRRQIGEMLAAEGLAISSVGLAVGLMLGGLISLILIYVVNRQSFHWSMSVHVPWLALSMLGAALLVLATLTTLGSARHAMGIDVVRAVKDDW